MHRGLRKRLGIRGSTVLAILAMSAFSHGASTDQAVSEDIESRYHKTCAVCHAAGVAGAPKTFDASGWAPRLKQGTDTLVASVKQGKGAMPPKGLCMDCSDAEFSALIEYMSKPRQ